MKLIRDITPFLPSFLNGCCVTLGNFDGVHIGHQAMIGALVKKACELSKPSVVILFEPQPLEFFSNNYADSSTQSTRSTSRGLSAGSMILEKSLDPADKPRDVEVLLAPVRLSSLRDKLSLIAPLGVDYVWVLKFNAQLSAMSPQQFLQTCLSRLNTKYALVGDDFRFGKARTGDIATLKSWALAEGVSVEVFQDVKVNHHRVSSTRLRAFLKEANLKEAFDLLGHPFTLTGRVVVGDGRGREWGIPTANIALKRQGVPLLGVYFVKVDIEGLGHFNGVANLGHRPTVDGLKCVLEVHVFDFDGNLYGKHLRVQFLDKIRDEQRFSSINELIQQIHRDIDEAKKRVLVHG